MRNQNEVWPAFIGSINGSKLIYLLKVVLLVFIPSLLLSVLIVSMGSENNADSPSSTIDLILAVVIFAPIVETIMLAIILFLLSYLRLSIIQSSLLCSLVVSGLHSLASPLWGLTVIWGFYVYSCVFLVWKKSFFKAFGIVTLLHMLQNGLACVLLIPD